MDKAEVERMKGLLVDAITTLCRSGMRYTNTMKIEGLLGITLDEKDIVLINLNKSIGSILNELSKGTVNNSSPRPTASRHSRRKRSVSESDSGEEEPRPKRRQEDERVRKYVGGAPESAGEFPMVKEEPESPPPTTDYSRVQANNSRFAKESPLNTIHNQSPIKAVPGMPPKCMAGLMPFVPHPHYAHSGYISKAGLPLRSEPPSHTISRPPPQQQIVRGADGEDVKIKVEVDSEQEYFGSDFENSSDWMSEDEDSMPLPDGSVVPVSMYPAMQSLPGHPAAAMAKTTMANVKKESNTSAEAADYFELAPPVDVRNIVRAENIPIFTGNVQPASPDNHLLLEDGTKGATKKAGGPPTQAPVPGTPNPQKNTAGAKSALNQWCSWAEMHEAESNEKVPPLEDLDLDELNYFLSCFITEMRKKDGGHYGIKTIHGFVTGVMKYLKEEMGHTDYNIFSEKDARFEVFRETYETLKHQLEELAAAKQPRYDTITGDVEQELWNKGQLGYHSAQVLLQTVYFYNSKIFRVRTNDGHHNLLVNQFKVGEDKRGQFVSFTPKKPKKAKEEVGEIKYYNDSRHLVNIYRIYLNIISSDGDSVESFYRKPASGMDFGSLKFTKSAISTNSLGQLMKQIFEGAKIEGNFSPHSFDTMDTMFE